MHTLHAAAVHSLTQLHALIPLHTLLAAAVHVADAHALTPLHPADMHAATRLCCNFGALCMVLNAAVL